MKKKGRKKEKGEREAKSDPFGSSPTLATLSLVQKERLAKMRGWKGKPAHVGERKREEEKEKKRRGRETGRRKESSRVLSLSISSRQGVSLLGA